MKIGSTGITNPRIGITPINKVFIGLDKVWPNVVDEFIFKINTNLGSGASFKYNPSSTTGVNYTIDYGDGTVVNYTSSGLQTHTYSSGGIYIIKILYTSGVFGYNFYKYDANKIIEVINWGTYSGLNSMFRCFRLCTNLTTISATDYPDLTNVISFNEMFVGCTSLIFPSSISNWDVSNVQDFTSCFRLSLFDINISSWNLSSATTINRIVKDTPFNQPIGAWSIPNVINVFNSFLNSNLDNNNYQNGIIGWTGWTSGAPTKTLKSNVSAHFGTAKYEIGGESEDVRNYLTGTLGWTITDGGGI
mgnify:FL=1|tara:strand:+ start:185 stop:1096 length:912 start_codon:yes stop_codon:yes gene_type:complete